MSRNFKTMTHKWAFACNCNINLFCYVFLAISDNDTFIVGSDELALKVVGLSG